MQLESVSKCPVCNSDGSVILEGCHDSICEIPGTWSFKQCHQCQSFWIDPRPTKEMIPSLYPKYYTHAEPSTPLLHKPQGILNQLWFSAKLGILERSYGYQGLTKSATSGIGKALGRIVSFVPSVSRWGGKTVRYVGHRSQERLLDVGCGNGSFLSLMSDLGWQTFGIEPDAEAAKVAVSQGLQVFQCSLEDADLEATSYDAITMSHVLEHLPNPRDAIKKLATSLKPGGLLVSISPNPTGVIAQWFGSNWRGLEPPRHLVLPSSKGYILLLQDLGFRVEVWTSSTFTLAMWMCRQSMGIRQVGNIHGYQGWLIPKTLGVLAQLMSLISINSGEEVICIAVKN
jgi:SAM-dependent methyltransferase